MDEQAGNCRRRGRAHSGCRSDDRLVVVGARLPRSGARGAGGAFRRRRPAAEPDRAASDRRGRHVWREGHGPYRPGRASGPGHRRFLSLRTVVAADARDLADDRRGPGGRLQRAFGDHVRHAPRGGGPPAGRADQGRSRHFRRSGPRGLRDEPARRRGGDRGPGRVHGRDLAAFSQHRAECLHPAGDHRRRTRQPDLRARGRLSGRAGAGDLREEPRRAGDRPGKPRHRRGQPAAA